MTEPELADRGAIVVTDDGEGVTFAGETGDLPLLASVLLAPMADAVDAVGPDPGTVVWTFPPGEPKAGEPTEAWERAVRSAGVDGAQARLGDNWW